MSKRFFIHFTLMMGVFLIINNLFFDTNKKSNKGRDTQNEDFNYIPTVKLNNEKGELICSSIPISGSLITITNKELPKILNSDDQQVHLIKKNINGLLLYSEKIKPTIRVSPLPQDDKTFHIVSNLTNREPEVFKAKYIDNKVHFSSEKPTENGIAVIKTKNGLQLIGLWDYKNDNLISANSLSEITAFISDKNSKILQ